MSAMNRITQEHINGLDWTATQFKLDAIAKNQNFFNKVKKSSPKQVVNFLSAFGATNCLEQLGVVKFAELLSIAKESPKFVEIDFVAFLTTELQLPESFVFEYSKFVDLSSMYTQEWCTEEKLVKYAEEVDIVGAILHNCLVHPERNEFISQVKEIVEQSIVHSYYGYCVSSPLLAKYGIKIDFSENELKIRNTVLNKKTMHKVGVPELLTYEGLTVDECSYKMNTSKGSYGSLIRLVSYIRSVYNEA